MRFLLLFLILSFYMKGQNNNLPFFEISSEKNQYTSANIIYRLIEGVGYRYYWASKDLKKKDLDYKPSSSSISSYSSSSNAKTFSLLTQVMGFCDEKHTINKFRNIIIYST